MPNMTMALPESLHKELRNHPEVKWSEVARRAFQAELERLHVFDRLLADSKLTERDAVALGRKVKAGLARRYRT